MKKYLVISITASVNGSRRYEKQFENSEDAHEYAKKRAKNNNVWHVKILYYRNIGDIVCCDPIWEYDKR